MSKKGLTRQEVFGLLESDRNFYQGVAQLAQVVLEAKSAKPSPKSQKSAGPAIILGQPLQIKTIFNWPGCELQEISVDFDDSLNRQREFFAKYNLPLPDVDQMRSVWQRNY